MNTVVKQMQCQSVTRPSGYCAIWTNMKGFTLVKNHSSVLSAKSIVYKSILWSKSSVIQSKELQCSTVYQASNGILMGNVKKVPILYQLRMWGQIRIRSGIVPEFRIRSGIPDSIRISFRNPDPFRNSGFIDDSTHYTDTWQKSVSLY